VAATPIRRTVRAARARRRLSVAPVWNATMTVAPTPSPYTSAMTNMRRSCDRPRRPAPRPPAVRPAARPHVHPRCSRSLPTRGSARASTARRVSRSAPLHDGRLHALENGHRYDSLIRRAEVSRCPLSVVGFSFPMARVPPAALPRHTKAAPRDRSAAVSIPQIPADPA